MKRPPRPASEPPDLGRDADANTGLFTLVGGWRVGLSGEEAAGVICTRNPGALEFEARLQWHPQTKPVAVFEEAPSFGEHVRADLEEDAADESGRRIRGTLSSPYEDELRAALAGLLREIACVASSREAMLTSRVLRSRRPLCAGSEAVESAARLLWEAGLGVGFGVSWSPAPEGADVVVGCRGAEERFAAAFSDASAPLVESRSVAG